MAPIVDEDKSLEDLIETNINKNRIMIFSKSTCGFCVRVKQLFQSLGEEYFALELDKLENGSGIQRVLSNKFGRKTVPQVFVNSTHVGGSDDTAAAHRDGTLFKLLNPSSESYDFDLIVIGGGSGGLSAAKTAADLGRKVAVFDFVEPTPKGSSWGLGGTCVNVGCIPKKLMHHSALLGQGLKDATKYGWQIPEKLEHSWEQMKDAVQAHIGSLNWGYRIQLRSKSVTYHNAYATFVEPHKIKAVDKKGKETIRTAEHFIIATGERPHYPACEGAKEYGITSDDLFSLPYCPGKTLFVGASYVSLECAGFLRGIGLDVTVMVRSILLRGFDQEMAEKIGSYMREEGVKFIRPCVPLKVEETESGQPGHLTVTGKMMDTEELVVGVYNTVVFAVGRDACTSNIGLETVGVRVNPKTGKILTFDERTSVPYVYAVGDVLEGKPELTPVAIQAGQLLARRLYAQSTTQCDYVNVPTTVFTPLEYGSIGYSEESAIAKFGEENIEVYHSELWPLEWTVAKRPENSCYLKLICLSAEKERIIGFHYLGPNAGEVTQGFALGMKMGATKADLDATVGIHPTCAEMFTTLPVTKRSGKSVRQTGC